MPSTVPSAAQLNLGNNVLTNKDTSPTEGPSSELAVAQAKISQGQQKKLTDTALKLASDFSAAQDKINLRTDNINRTREFNDYFKNQSKEYQSFVEGDVTNPESLTAFVQNLQTNTETALNNHQGSPESRNRFAMRLENQRAQFSAQAKAASDTAQKSIIDKQFSEDIAGVVSKIATGEITMSKGLLEVDEFGDEYAEVGSDIDTFNRVEAAQQLVILGSLQRLVDLGDSDKAEALINSNPEVIQTLQPEQVVKLIRNIEKQKSEKRKLIAKKAIERDDILKGFGVTDPKDLPPSGKLLYWTGKLGKDPVVKDNRTDEMKNAEELARLETKHGKESPQYQNLAQLVFKQEKDEEEDSELHRMFKNVKKLRKENTPESNKEADIIENQINEKDPKFIENKKLEKELPKAQELLSRLESETDLMLKSIDEALILATNTNNIDEALRDAKKGDAGFFETGNIGLITSFVRGESEAANLEATLTPIAANVVLQTMSEMRAQSSAGATGLGAMNTKEMEMLRDSKGSLDPRKPTAMFRTLLAMRKSLPKILERQKIKFKTGFAPILGTDLKIPDPNIVENPENPRGGPPKSGVIDLRTFGDGDNEPPPITKAISEPPPITKANEEPPPVTGSDTKSTTVPPATKSTTVPPATKSTTVPPATKPKNNKIMDKYNETEKRVSKVLKKYNIKKIPIDLDFALIDLERFADTNDTKGFNKQVDKIKEKLEETINDPRLKNE